MQANQLLIGPPSPMLPELMRALEIPGWRKILQRHALWVEWMQFQQMMQAVQKGEMDPQAAVNAIMQKAMQVIGPKIQQAQATQGPQPKEPGAPQPPQPIGQG
jgi:hypothetical protein